MNDLAIVGGGPAGLATAIWAAQRGLSSVVLEQRLLPLDKACGEGLMPPGVAALAAMGVEVPAWGRTPFVGIRYIDGAVIAEGRFQGGPGWGVRRTALVQGMVGRARALGVDMRYGCPASAWRRSAGGRVEVETPRGSVQARVLVGADGLVSRVRREAGLGRQRRDQGRFGVRRHYRLAPWSSFVEVYWGDGAEAYITPVGASLVGIAFLWDGTGETFDDLLARFPALRDRLGDAPTESETRGGGPFRQRVRRRHTEDVALVGDAAGYLDALTGEGLTLAFHCAGALVEVLAHGKSLRAYESDYRRLSRTYYWVTGLLLAVRKRPWLRRRMMNALARQPGLFDRLLAINCGEPLASLGVGGLLRLINGMAR
jgi:flavin-dependent dehydrogenase